MTKHPCQIGALQTEQVPKTDKLEKYNMDAMKSFICDIAHEMPSIFKKSWSESIPYYVFSSDADSVI